MKEIITRESTWEYEIEGIVDTIETWEYSEELGRYELVDLVEKETGEYIPYNESDYIRDGAVDIPVLEEKVKVNMKKLSGLLQKCSPQAPIIGVNGYAGEQDGTKVLTTQVLHFSSRKHADEKYPNGVPNYMKTHWAKRTQLKCYDGIEHWKEWVWEVVLYCWSNDPYEGDNNPFEMS